MYAYKLRGEGTMDKIKTFEVACKRIKATEEKKQLTYEEFDKKVNYKDLDKVKLSAYYGISINAINELILAYYDEYLLLGEDSFMDFMDGIIGEFIRPYREIEEIVANGLLDNSDIDDLNNFHFENTEE